MKYKKIKKAVPYCDKCNHEIWGNGSVIIPHQCNCGIYEYDFKKKDYILKNS
jgi:hypothetical protein